MPRCRDIIEALGDAAYRVRRGLDRLTMRGRPPAAADAELAAGPGASRWTLLCDPRQLRERLRQRPALLVAGCAAALAAAGGIAWLSLSGERRPQAWFYDVGSGEVFVADAAAAPPVTAPSRAVLSDGSPGGVRAYLFACGACTRQSRFVGYLERLESATHRVVTGAAALPALDAAVSYDDFVERGVLVASPDAPHAWVSKASEEGAAIRDAAYGRCGEGVTVELCAAP